MKRIIIVAFALLSAVSCTSLIEEFQPVFKGSYDNVPEEDLVEMTPTHTIAQLVFMYNPGSEKPVELGLVNGREIIIEGRVASSDKEGNVYKSLYIQDATGGLEVKIGKNGLYNDYKPGQTIYVNCTGLWLGMYGYKERNDRYSRGGYGMVQLGAKDPSGTYETSYLEETRLINEHIFKGALGDPLTPAVVTAASQLPSWNDTQASNSLIGKLVTIKGLTYGNEVFSLIYLDSNKDKKSYTNRIFLSSSNNASDATCGITTWAMSQTKMTNYMKSGVWDICKVGSGNTYLTDEGGNTVTVGSLKGDGSYPSIEKAAASVSQYFKLGSTNIQIRTSGYSRYGDFEIPQDVLKNGRAIDVTGILTLYEGSIQLVTNSYGDHIYSDTGEKLPRL